MGGDYPQFGILNCNIERDFSVFCTDFFPLAVFDTCFRWSDRCHGDGGLQISALSDGRAGVCLLHGTETSRVTDPTVTDSGWGGVGSGLSDNIRPYQSGDIFYEIKGKKRGKMQM